MSKSVAYLFKWEKKLLRSQFIGKIAANDQIDKRFMFIKEFQPKGVLPGGYVHVHVNYFQTSFSLNPLGQSKPNIMWRLLGKLGNLFYRNGPGHKTKIAAMPISMVKSYLKPIKICSRTRSLIILASRLKVYKLCINDDPWLTLTCLATMLN